jgi:hypothetical protein
MVDKLPEAIGERNRSIHESSENADKKLVRVTPGSAYFLTESYILNLGVDWLLG